MVSIASSSRMTEAGRAASLWPGLVSLLLGAAFLFGTGFAQIPSVHNAAHDARHAAGFPCH